MNNSFCKSIGIIIAYNLASKRLVIKSILVKNNSNTDLVVMRLV